MDSSERSNNGGSILEERSASTVIHALPRAATNASRATIADIECSGSSRRQPSSLKIPRSLLTFLGSISRHIDGVLAKSSCLSDTLAVPRNVRFLESKKCLSRSVLGDMVPGSLGGDNFLEREGQHLSFSFGP